LTLAGLLAGLMTSCRTIDTLVEAPDEFWLTLWLLVEAILEDIAGLIL